MTALKVGVIGARAVGAMQGGIETYCASLYPRLPASRFEFSIYTSRPSRWSGEGEIRVIRIPTPRLKLLETPLNAVVGVVLAWLSGIRTLHVHGLSAAVSLPLARLLGMRTVVRHLGAEYERTKWGPSARLVLKLSEWFVAMFADTVVCLNQHIAGEFERNTGRTARVVVIPNGVSQPAQVRPTAVHARLGLVPGAYVLAVGRLVAEKNFHLLVPAFQRARLPPEVKLVIAGAFDYPGKYSREFRRLVRGEARVVMAGEVIGDDLWALYARCGLFVLPSSHEGMSFALLEAAGAGAKIVASNIPANVAVCDGFGRLVQVNSVEALAEGMAQEWRRERTARETLSQIALCSSRHDWDLIGRMMEGVLSPLQAEAAGPPPVRRAAGQPIQP